MARFQWSLAVALTVASFAWGQTKVDGKTKTADPPQSVKKPAKAKKAAAKKFLNPLEVRVTTWTGKNNKYSNSPSVRVFFLLNASDAHKARLTNRETKPFQLGAKDSFVLKFDMPLDKIESFRIAVEGTDMWKCENVDVQFVQNGNVTPAYKFKVEKYLSTGNERKVFHAVPSMDFTIKPKFEKKKDEATGEAKEK